MDEKIHKDIAEHGWTVLAVEATDYLPSFAFTLGLWQRYRHPEIISFGLPVQTLQNVLNLAGELVKEGKILSPGINYDDFFEQSEATFIKVDAENMGDYFAYAQEFYKDDNFPALQLIWQDRKQRFPWQEGYEAEFRYSQPLLDRNMQFKYSEEPGLTVFTTEDFLSGSAPVTKVLHATDANWHFLTAGATQATATTTLEHMLQSDPSLNNLFNLDLGEQATRSSATDKWQRAIS